MRVSNRKDKYFWANVHRYVSQVWKYIQEIFLDINFKYVYHMVQRRPILNLFSWVISEKRTRLRKRIWCWLKLLVVHHYCFPVYPGVSEVYVADKYSFLDIIFPFIKLKIRSVKIHQSFLETVRMLHLFHSIPNIIAV